MTLYTRIASWAFVASFAAAPSLAIAAAECGSRCCPPAARYEAPGDCGGMLGTMSCCDAAPATAMVSSGAKRAPQAPTHQPALATRWISIPDAARARPPASAGHQGAPTSPLHLSVVLLI